MGRRWLYSQRTKPLENFLELIHFEDLPLGGGWTTRRRTITEADLAGYVGLSGDFNPLYADVEHARKGPYRGLVVPAPLIATVVTGLGSMDVPIPHTVALVGWNWTFKAPVRPGDSICSRWRINRKRDVEDPRWGLVSWQVEVENQAGDLVAVGEVIRLVARRDGGEQAGEADAVEGARSSGRRRRRRRGGGDGGPPPEVVAGQLAAQSAAAPDAVEVSPIVQPEAPALAGVPPAVEAGPPPSRRRRRRRGNGNGGATGNAPDKPPAAGEGGPQQAQPERPSEEASFDDFVTPREPGPDPFF